jgi:large subunit ribosomal protein L17
MRHKVQKRKLGRSSAHRDAMLRNMVTSLLEYERIETTLPKAKELRRVADRMITLGKRGDLGARRLALKVIRKKDVVHKLFAELAILFDGRAGGYTRILRLGNRPGDNSEMAIIELTAKTAKKEAKKPSAKGEKKSAVQEARDSVTESRKAAKKAPAKKAPARKAAAPKKAKAKKEEAAPESDTDD